MDRIKQYQQIIQNYLEAEVKQTINPDFAVPRILILDKLADRYILLAKGWLKKKYVHYFIYHLEIVDGKIWIHEDRTDTGIAVDLVELGIPKSDIILGYFPKYARAMSDFGVV